MSLAILLPILVGALGQLGSVVKVVNAIKEIFETAQAEGRDTLTPVEHKRLTDLMDESDNEWLRVFEEITGALNGAVLPAEIPPEQESE